MSQQMSLFIQPDGTLSFVFDDRLMEALGDLGAVKTVRCSHVEPTSDGRHWAANMSPICGQPIVLGPFPTRGQALAAEQEWLDNYFRSEQSCNRAMSHPSL